MDSGERLVAALAARFDQLMPLLAEHLDDNNGEVLPHVLFWNFTRAVVDSYLGRPSQVAWREFVMILDEEYKRGDAYLRGIVDVSFLENLPFPDEDGHEIVMSLPVGLRAAFDRVRPGG